MPPKNPAVVGTREVRLGAYKGYVPDGVKAEDFLAEREANRKAMKEGKLGAGGPRGFKSRSMDEFVRAMERGEVKHLMPVENAKEKLARGEIKMEDIPYMQRGGNWDNSDVKGAKLLNRT